MTDDHHFPEPLKLPIRPGMRVGDVTVELTGVVVAITERWCILRLDVADELLVSPWPQIALMGIQPNAAILSPDVEQRDRRNKIADVLRVLLLVDEPDEEMRSLIKGLEREVTNPVDVDR